MTSVEKFKLMCDIGGVTREEAANLYGLKRQAVYQRIKFSDDELRKLKHYILGKAELDLLFHTQRLKRHVSDLKKKLKDIK